MNLRGHHDPVEWDAARLALLALRGNIHPARPLAADAYAVLPRRSVVRTAAATIPTLVAAPKPLVCRAYASGGVVVIRFGPPPVGGLERAEFFLAAEQVEWNSRNPETSIASSLGKMSGRHAPDAGILCAGREDRIVCSEKAIARWERDYAIVACNLFVDDVDDHEGPESALRTDARARDAAGVLAFGRYPPS